MEFVAALRAAREDAGFSLVDAAELLGISANALGGWERGLRRKRLPKTTVERLEEIYGVDDQRLLRAGGYAVSGTPPDPARLSFSYSGDPLTPTEEAMIIEYIDFIRSKRPR